MRLNQYAFIILFSSLLFTACSIFTPRSKQLPDVGKTIQFAEAQTSLMIRSVDEAKKQQPQGVAPRTLDGEQLKLVPSRDWTSGFFAGELWLLYQATGNEKWKQQARHFTAPLAQEQWNGTTHDMGFKIYNSFGQGYRLTGDTAYRRVILQSARTLSTRFNPTVGCIRSWDHNRDRWEYPVIIDNMMNLELLFAATKFSGDSSFYKVAVRHAYTTMHNHYRPDYSSFHVVDYDSTTGRVRQKNTAQGLDDTSAWARGQSWGLYGFTMCYRETGDTAFLRQAENIAAYLLKRLPEDKIPYWDYDDPAIPDAPRDASAAAIMASALYELSRYSKNANLYRTTADEILGNLDKHYRSSAGTHKGFLLLHSTGHKPINSEVDVPLVYADYYFLEAILRKAKIPYADLR